MANLTQNVDRKASGTLRRLPLAASVISFVGSLIGVNAGTGYHRRLEAGDAFAGIARQQIRTEDAPAANGDVNLEVEAGIVPFEVASITGATGKTDIGSKVYASDDTTFTLTSTSNSLIGKISGYDNGRFIVTGVTHDLQDV